MDTEIDFILLLNAIKQYILEPEWPVAEEEIILSRRLGRQISCCCLTSDCRNEELYYVAQIISNELCR